MTFVFKHLVGSENVRVGIETELCRFLFFSSFCLQMVSGGESIQSLQINVYVGQSHGSLLQSPQRSRPEERKTGKGTGQYHRV